MIVSGPRLVILPALLAGVTLVSSLSGCTRRTTFLARSDDSTSTAAADSITQRIRTAQQAWDAPDSGGVAARLTAAIVLQDLQAHITAEPRLNWADRARVLIDSLDVGAEYASAPCAMVVNFFARGNPSAGSWPWLFSCGETRLRASSIPGQGMALQGVASRGLYGEPPRPPGARGVAVLFARRGTVGQQPVLMVLRPTKSDDWTLTQTLGPDSLGGAGTGSFTTPGDSTVDLETRTFSNTPHFEECATCPHVYRVHRFRWRGDGFTRLEDRVSPSPYATFVMFIRALSEGDREAAERLVADPSLVDAARDAEWGVPRGSWRAAPATDETAHEMIFFRGMKEAWRVGFQPRGTEWLIGGFQPTTRSLE